MSSQWPWPPANPSRLPAFLFHSPATQCLFLRSPAKAMASSDTSAPAVVGSRPIVEHPAQPARVGADGGTGGGVGGGPEVCGSTLGAAEGKGAPSAAETPASTTGTLRGMASTGPFRVRRLSGGTAPRTNAAKLSPAARGTNPILDAGRAAGIGPMDQGSVPGGPPQTPRRGSLHAMGPVQGCRI